MTRAACLTALLCCLAPAVAVAQQAEPPVAQPAPAAPAPQPAPAPAAAPPAVAPQPAAPRPAPVAQPAAVQPAPAPAVAPAPKAAAPDAAKKVEDDLVEAARQFYRALVSKNAEKLAVICKAPFFFEGKMLSTDVEVKKKWESSLQNELLDGVRLAGVTFFTPEEMAARFGKAPDRLNQWPLKGGMLSVGNLSGHAAVVLWRKNGTAWQATGFHD